jgi:hypothetical protein
MPPGAKFNPNSRTDRASIEHWIKFSDIYTFKHITQFDSWADLLDKLQTADLNQISAQMRVENKRVLAELKDTWKKMFNQMFAGMLPGGRQVPLDFDTGMKALYGETISTQEPSCQRKSTPEVNCNNCWN